MDEWGLYALVMILVVPLLVVGTLPSIRLAKRASETTDDQLWAHFGWVAGERPNRRALSHLRLRISLMWAVAGLAWLGAVVLTGFGVWLALWGRVSADLVWAASFLWLITYAWSCQTLADWRLFRRATASTSVLESSNHARTR
jgi:hypothetical protein